MNPDHNRAVSIIQAWCPNIEIKAVFVLWFRLWWVEKLYFIRVLGGDSGESLRRPYPAPDLRGFRGKPAALSDWWGSIRNSREFVQALTISALNLATGSSYYCFCRHAHIFSFL
jgi:hypothetical protein